VLVNQTPNPWPVARGPVARWPRVGFTVKPMVFQYLSASLLVKPLVFNDFGGWAYKTNAFLMNSVARSIKPMCF